MHLRDLQIVNKYASISIIDGRVLEVFRDRRTGPYEARVGEDARRRKPPQALEPHLGTGRIWVATGWLAVDATEAAHFPRAREMTLRHPEYDTWHLTSLRSNHELAMRLELEHALVFDFHALLLPTVMQLERMKAMRLVKNLKPLERT